MTPAHNPADPHSSFHHEPHTMTDAPQNPHTHATQPDCAQSPEEILLDAQVVEYSPRSEVDDLIAHVIADAQSSPAPAHRWAWVHQRLTKTAAAHMKRIIFLPLHTPRVLDESGNTLSFIADLTLRSIIRAAIDDVDGACARSCALTTVDLNHEQLEQLKTRAHAETAHGADVVVSRVRGPLTSIDAHIVLTSLARQAQAVADDVRQSVAHAVRYHAQVATVDLAIHVVVDDIDMDCPQ